MGIKIKRLKPTRKSILPGSPNKKMKKSLTTLCERNTEVSSEDSSDEESELHIPPDTLEVASDDSEDSENEEEVTHETGKVTIQMVNKWEKELNSNKRNMKPVSSVVHAFHGCLVRITGGDTTANDSSSYRVDGSSEFNAVIRLCVTSIYPYLSKIMNLPTTSVTKKHIESSKKWLAVKNIVRVYINDLVKLLGNVTSEDILRVLLKHLHQMMPFAACLPTISKSIVKQLIKLWSSNNDDTVKVISFLCILRYVTSDVSMYLHTILKKMYVSYVTNCKFISQNSVPAVNFMRKSLTELFSLNEVVTYNHAFLYIRQLAIHLRSAITLKKKDSIQTVYNWQFVSSLRLWIDVLCIMHEKQQISALIYPTVQIIIGCMKLIPTAQYFPLRFRCIQMLIKLSKETGIFIPVLPFLIEALSILQVNVQHKKLSMKPMDFTYILRLSKSQLQENAFKDAVIENIYDCLLEYTATESYRISFPDTVVLLQIQMKQFLKDCKNVNYTRKLKPLLEKIEEVSKLMDEERKKCGISLSDAKAIVAWESNMKLKTNALITFYESWRKMQEQKFARKTTDKIKITEYELPVLKKHPEKKREIKKANKVNGEHVTLFASDSSDEDDVSFSSKHEKKKTPDFRGKQNTNSRRRKVNDSKSKSIAKRQKIDIQQLEDDSKDRVEDLNFSEFLS